jgi:hypothetical protein
MQSFGDEAFGNLGTVGVGSVNEGDAQLDSATEDTTGRGWVGGFSPSAIADQTHSSVTEAANGKIAAHEEDTAGGC